MAESIRIDTGIKEFDLNGAVTVYFCPTDVTFAEKLFSIEEAIEKKTEEYSERIDKLEDNKDVFEAANALDREIREMLNSIFDTDICTPLVGTTKIYAIANGLPIWANTILGLIDAMDADLEEQKKRTKQRIKKYTEKYKRRK